MRQALFAAIAATAILFLGVLSNGAVAMPIAPPSVIGLAASESRAVQEVRYWRWHHHYRVWYGRPYWEPSRRYECCGFPDGYGYNPGPYWGLGGYLNSWYM